MNIERYAMIDLHLHLDGSLSPQWLLEWAEKQAISLPTTDPTRLLSFISAPQDCSDLNQYLRSFEIPLAVLQSPQALTAAVTHLIERLDQAQMLYAEIRFAPQLHTQKTMDQEQAVLAAIAGLQAVENCHSLFKVNLILCCMRGEDNQAENHETVRLAQKYLGQGVVAIDLAGAEGLYPTAHYQTLFSEAVALGVPFTLHAGEAAGADSVQQALDFGATRIGHGVRAVESEAVVLQLIDRKTPLEMCPCSNLQTKTVASLSQYPLRHYLERGVVATVNTDNMTVSNTTVAHEFALLKRDYRLTNVEARQLVQNAVQAAFLCAEDKQILWEKVQQRWATANLC
ncbi:adenosine deaminase [[Actinobacillus] muris]|uniref:adenosine deaminase n=1 Tax=Muribacter muris TaxID=67855 RepID=A0A0J5P703_9PAST|nr:adenosine deaminase [Muribacter muris]KMK51555.1 adenosine deaminase [[Actinobacillus] muris] [Muribacter muris]